MDVCEMLPGCAAARLASAELGRDVNVTVTVMTRQEWEDEPTGFISQVKSGRLVELDLS